MKTKDVADRSNEPAETSAVTTPAADKSETKNDKSVAQSATVTKVPGADAAHAHPHLHTPELAAHKAAHATSTDIAKITAGLFVGVLALMTFLLSVGLQHPKPMIRSFLYVSYVALGLTLLAYVLEVLMTSRAVGMLSAVVHGQGNASAAAKASSAAGLVRLAQNVLFVVAIVGTVGFALSASQLFFVTQAQPQATTQGQ